MGFSHVGQFEALADIGLNRADFQRAKHSHGRAVQVFLGRDEVEQARPGHHQRSALVQHDRRNRVHRTRRIAIGDEQAAGLQGVEARHGAILADAIEGNIDAFAAGDFLHFGWNISV